MSKIMMPVISVAALAAACPNALRGSVRMDAGDNPEALLKEVNQQLQTLNGEIKKTAEQALKESKAAGDLSAATKATTDELLARQSATMKAVDDLKALVEGVETKTLEISQQVAAGGGSSKSSVMSLGQAVLAEGADRIKTYKGGTLSLTIQNAVTTASGSGGGLIYHEEEREPVRMPRRRLLVRNLLMPGRTNSDQVHYRKQVLRTSGAGMVAETTPSGASEFGWDKAVERVKKIATHTNISEEALADADQLQSEIDGELRYLIDLEEEKQIVAGDGVGENLTGLLTQAPAFVAAAGLPNANRIDRLRLALLQVTLEDYMPAEILLNPTDWAAIELQKVGGTDERYVYGDPGAQATPRLWGKDVVETNTMSVGEWLVGDLAMAATYYDRSETEVLLSTEHDQNFIEDMITMKARKRVAMAIKRALAMVKGNFTFV
ncbi:phage major capsid protein [Palleronia caenipelagi]|uniref:Phage major capsid protein n=1 Tax=Palleronia caenipelagi TaxID=2489174 RepID=A0A547Q6B8_9RHOB|nr:phage major capsid protein [Palleronia caenipelagi]TRD21904.1 phage major capsid protein [Palleronia caenipelagi]